MEIKPKLEVEFGVKWSGVVRGKEREREKKKWERKRKILWEGRVHTTTQSISIGHLIKKKNNNPLKKTGRDNVADTWGACAFNQGRACVVLLKNTSRFKETYTRVVIYSYY